MYTSTDIALMSLEQVKSLNVSELKICCKNLNLKGYSKLTKIHLIDLVFNASDVERQTLINAKKEKTTASERRDRIAKYQRKENALKEHPINVLTINKLLKKGLSMEVIANTLFKVCCDNYADLTVAKNCTKKLHDVLPLTNLDQVEQANLKESWRLLAYSINFARKEQENLITKSYARSATKTLDSKALIDWAKIHLTNDNEIIKGLALALLSGRRMIEIYGTTSYKLGQIGIFATGIAKKSDHQDDTCEFIPLCDRDEWLKSLNSLTKRNLDKKKVNGSISKLASRHFPMSLKDLGIDKFKDCRDVYAAIVYQTFELVARDAIPFTKEIMGHKSQESTAYYRKYDCEPIEELKGLFEEYILL